MASRMLVINPNSTTAMTEALKPVVKSLKLENISIHYFTGPPTAPPSIDDEKTCRQSADYCLPELIHLLAEYDGFLVACYSEHPLVPILRAEIRKRCPTTSHQKFVLGIFEASILHSLSLVDSEGNKDERGPFRWGIVTTGKIWEELLTTGVENFLGVSRSGNRRFAGVSTTGLNANQLHELPTEEVDLMMKAATQRILRDKNGGKVTVVCLGCAGMVGLEPTVKEAAREIGYRDGELKVVDGVKAGVLVLEGLMKGRYSS